MHLLALSDLNSDRLHHAYCVVSANRQETANAIAAWWSGNGERFMEPRIMMHQTLVIDEARELSRIAQYKTGDNHSVYIIGAASITNEAQNALLKLFEEPTPGVHFFLIVPSFDILLPTIQSRIQKINIDIAIADTTIAFDAKKFLTDSPSARIATIEKLLKKATDADEAKSDITRTVIDAIEDHVAQANNPTPKIMDTLQTVRKYANLQGASHKILLEYLALAL